MTKYKFVNPRQSGFRSLFSTAIAMLDLTNEWSFNIDRKLINGALFLDLEKLLILSTMLFYFKNYSTLNYNVC